MLLLVDVVTAKPGGAASGCFEVGGTYTECGAG